jgi:glycosyltransferase involved in cell wall biosynthesis
MKIAQIAPLAEACPPHLYGGTERIVSALTDELVRQGHEVTLFASGDSTTAAQLVPCVDRALRLNPAFRDPVPHHVLMLEEVRRRAGEFDVLHFHLDLLHFPLVRALGARALTTLHGRLDLPELAPFYRAFDDVPLVSISMSQRAPMPPVSWLANVPHGISADRLRFNPGPSDPFLAFVGRISPEKRPDRAIAIAARAGLPLKIAAKVDPVDQGYWDRHVAPLVAAHPGVEYVGEVDDAHKADLLGRAAALLFPIDWPEPFGLVMIEAMACGTPVVAFRCGSVPEVVDEGVTGFIVDDCDAAVAAVRRIGSIDRAGVRARFEQRFTAERMATDYLAAYRLLLDEPARLSVAA